MEHQSVMSGWAIVQIFVDIAVAAILALWIGTQLVTWGAKMAWISQFVGVSLRIQHRHLRYILRRYFSGPEACDAWLESFVHKHIRAAPAFLDSYVGGASVLLPLAFGYWIAVVPCNLFTFIVNGLLGGVAVGLLWRMKSELPEIKRGINDSPWMQTYRLCP